MAKNIFSIRFKALRKGIGFTQLEIAKVLGVSRSMINRIENYGEFTNHDTLLIIAAYFGVSIDYLYGLDDIPNRRQSDEESAALEQAI